MQKFLALRAGLILLLSSMTASAHAQQEGCDGLREGLYFEKEQADYNIQLSCVNGNIALEDSYGTYTYKRVGPGLYQIDKHQIKLLEDKVVQLTSSGTILYWNAPLDSSEQIQEGTYREKNGTLVALSALGEEITVKDPYGLKVYKRYGDSLYKFKEGEVVFRVVGNSRIEFYAERKPSEVYSYDRIGDLSIFDQEEQKKRKAQAAVIRSRYPSVYQSVDDDYYEDDEPGFSNSSNSYNPFDFWRSLASDAARDANERAAIDQRYQDRLADLRRQQQQQSTSSSSGGNANNYGARVVAQEQARAEALRREREQREQAERRLAEQQAQQQRARAEEARLAAERERTRPVEWVEGVVLCEPRSGSKQWRCTGPLQTNVLELDAPNTIAQLGLACGSANGIREIGQTGGYRAYGCGFGIHPTAKNYPGNRDVPADFGVYVGDRRVFHCPTSKDAYCRNP